MEVPHKALFINIEKIKEGLGGDNSNHAVVTKSPDLFQPPEPGSLTAGIEAKEEAARVYKDERGKNDQERKKQERLLELQTAADSVLSDVGIEYTNILFMDFPTAKGSSNHGRVDLVLLGCPPTVTKRLLGTSRASVMSCLSRVPTEP